jgi:hypothetical protein
LKRRIQDLGGYIAWTSAAFIGPIVAVTTPLFGAHVKKKIDLYAVM